MKRNLTIGQQIAAGFLLPIVVLIGLGFLSYDSTQRFMKTSYWVAHTHDVLHTLTDLLSGLQDVETGQRGYVITGKENFLEPYKNGLEMSNKAYERIKKLTSDNPRQQRRIDALRLLMNERTTTADNLINLRKTAGFEQAAALESEGAGKRLMDEVRKGVAEMTAEEHDLLAERSLESEQASSQITKILVGGTLGAMLLVALVATFIIRNLGRHIGGIVQNMRTAATEFEAAATQQVKGAKEQSASTTEVATTVHELVASSRQIAENAQRVMKVSTEMTTAAKDGDQTVATAQEAIDIVRRQVDQIVGHMLSLGKKSQDIGGILEIITELAEQTNILAINATIEAVGAGESGLRFGVVAGEIRKLADRVGASAKEIRRLIEEIRSSANTTVMATEDGAKAVEAGARRFTDVTESFHRIAEHVISTTESTREIELSTKQQLSAMEQVSTAMADVTQTARESEASATQIQRTASDLSDLSIELVRLIETQAA